MRDRRRHGERRHQPPVEEGRPRAVRVVVQIPQMPGYHEQVMVDSLARKLRLEYGDPPKKAPTPNPREKDAKDGGAADGDGGS